MSRSSLVDRWLDQWESCLQRGDAETLDRFIRRHCGGAAPELVAEFRSKVVALGSIDAKLRGPGDAFSSTNRGARQKTGGSSLSGDLGLIPGTELIPGYRLLTRLGRGGFGEVWKALGPGGVLVALKVILARGNHQRIEEQAFHLTKHLRHPHVLLMMGAWQLADRLVIAMELADRTLGDRFQEARSEGLRGIPRGELLQYLRQAAEALDHLHGLTLPGGDENTDGIQHRDIKPQNLLLSGSNVKIADFGLALYLQDDVRAHTGGMTPAYAAPEFFQRQTSRHSDQYSLAVTYCYLRGGRLPFAGEEVEIITGHLRRAPDLAMLPAKERPAIARALAKDPNQRWGSCAAFVEALAACQGQTHVHDTPDPPEHAGRVAQPGRGRRQVHLSLDRHRRWVAGVLLVLFLIGSLGFYAGWTLIREKNAVSHPTPSGPASWGGASVPDQPAATRESNGADSPIQDSAAQSKPALPSAPVATEEKPVLYLRIGDDGAKAQQKCAQQTGRPEQWTNRIGMQFRLIPAGEFLMGSPATEEGRAPDEFQHRVQLTRSFYLAVYEVTQQEYEAVMASNPSRFKGPRHPVEQVSWDEAVSFCDKLSAMEGKKYRLPTEAEWEYACRAGTSTRTYLGNSVALNQANLRSRGTRDIGSYPPNPFGLCDMYGNVAEWCADWYGAEAYRELPFTDPQGPAIGERRVVRGASWFDGPGTREPTDRRCRSAFRGLCEIPGRRFDRFGFRILLEIEDIGPPR